MGSWICVEYTLILDTIWAHVLFMVEISFKDINETLGHITRDNFYKDSTCVALTYEALPVSNRIDVVLRQVRCMTLLAT